MRARMQKTPDGRGERIRTSGPLLPKQVLYQAELRPGAGRVLADADRKYQLGGRKKESSSFLKKRTKKLLSLAGGTKVALLNH